MSPQSNPERFAKLVRYGGAVLLAVIGLLLLFDGRITSDPNQFAQEEQHGLGWIILGSAVFYFITTGFNERKTETRSVTKKQVSTLATPFDRYLLSLPNLYDERQKKQSLIYLTAFIFIFSVTGYVYSSLFAAAERTGHGVFLLIFTGLIAVLPLIVVGVVTKPERRLLALSRRETPRLEVSTLGLSVSGLLLTDPARWRILETGKSELFIPWQDLLQIDVTQGGGNSPPQYLLYVGGSTAKFGRGAMGVGAGLPAPIFGIIRTHLGKSDALVGTALERFATCPIRIQE
jgi:hypothetical protein